MSRRERDTAPSRRQENIELVRRFEQGWSKRDLDAVLECVDDGVEFDWSESRSPFVGNYRGRDGVTRFFRDMLDAWEEFSPEAEEFVECGPDTLESLDVVRARGKGSGIYTEARGAMLWTVKEGRIARAKMFQTKEEALAAAELPERSTRG
jgi:ketosteroid isomerase-like protein